MTIKEGRYTVVDSDPATWSHNSASGFAGFTYIQGYAVAQEMPPALSISLSPNGRILIAWPKSAAGFALFHRAALNPSSGWSPVSEQALDEGEQRVVSLQAQEKSEFYRLAK